MLRIECDESWTAGRVDGLPDRWRSRLLRRWEGRAGAEYREANAELREITDVLQAVRLPLDASDGDICVRAEELARECLSLGSVFHEPGALREAMGRKCDGYGVAAPNDKIETGPAIARMTDVLWWRRGLRKMHAKAVEGAAIRLGYVNRSRDLYVSNESLARRGQQLRRNQRMLDETVMRNELDQEFTLAELAAKGTANKAIRRGELMTRIAGFERIALDCGHGGLFLTATCPSRMHKWISAGAGKVYENRKYDGTTPREAQAYLSKCYQRIRAKLHRDGLGVYGFRIAEPHHDGCPHWHILLFHPLGMAEAITDIFRRYLLADSPDEVGAQAHRVTSEVIDWSRGTAAGYIAKYVAKNIDGLHVENDLYGNPALETSQRVEAWASTWGIRQFQQVGGAPVGVWRELRRVREVPEGAPDHLKAAHVAVNKILVERAAGDAITGAQSETAAPVVEKSADWAGYVQAQGGPLVGRDYKIRLAKEQTGEVGRYGEVMAAQPVGVETVGGETYRDGIVPDRFRLVHWLVQSVRHVWEVVRRAGRSLAPRTCVNNCTRGGGGNGREAGGGAAREDLGGRKGGVFGQGKEGAGGAVWIGGLFGAHGSEDDFAFA